MPRRRTVLVAIPALGTVTARAADAVRGSGTPGSERRTVAGFSRIASEGDFSVEIRQGTREGLEITADDNLLALVETVVEGTPGAATLRIRPRRNTAYSPSRPTDIRVDVKSLTGLSLGGAGRFSAASLQTPALAIAVGGSGDVDIASLAASDVVVSIGGSGMVALAGRTQRLAVKIGGSGTCAAAPLSADEVSVQVGGSGDVEVTAQTKLVVAIAGSGTVRYAGAATPVATVAGNGTLKRL